MFLAEQYGQLSSITSLVYFKAETLLYSYFYLCIFFCSIKCPRSNARPTVQPMCVGAMLVCICSQTCKCGCVCGKTVWTLW